MRLAPAEHQTGQQQAAAQLRYRRRDRQSRIIGALADAKRDLIGFEVADRAQPRQQQRRAGIALFARQTQKGLAQRTRRAAGRQQHRHARQPQRVALGHAEQAARKRRQKRAVRRNGVNVLRH